MELHEALERVRDEASFLQFVRLLAADRTDASGKEAVSPTPYGPGANGWENTTIDAFLEGAISWAEDSDFGVAQGLPRDNTWQRFATFLYCGKIYE